jgi:hypothetical protein
MSFIAPLARIAASTAGKGRLSAFMLGRGMGKGENQTEQQSQEQAPPQVPTLKDIVGPIV